MQNKEGTERDSAMKALKARSEISQPQNYDNKPDHEEEMHGSLEHQYRVALDTPADVILSVDINLRIITFLFNERFKAWKLDLGTNLIGRPLFEAFPCLSEKARDEYRHVLETREMVVAEETFRVGNTTYFVETKKIANVRKGDFAGIITVARDITDRKLIEIKLRESEECYRVAIENSNDGVAILRGEEHIYVNRKFIEMFGFDSAQEIIGRPGYLVVHPDDRLKVEAARIDRLTGEAKPKRYEFKGIRKDGTPIYVEVSAAQAGFEKPEEHFENIKGGDETILLAEDNPEVRKLANEILTNKGYTVIEASDGDDAVQKFLEHGNEIDLLFLDVVMPKKNGKEVYEEIQKIRPRIRVLFASGYTRDVVFNKGIHNRSDNYIPKPLMPDDLLKKVRQILDK